MGVACRAVDNRLVIHRVRVLLDRLRPVCGASFRALTAVVLVVLLAACGSTRSTVNGTTAESGAATGSTAIPTLLQFTAPLVGGGEFAGARYAGKATAFWFWAPT